MLVARLAVLAQASAYVGAVFTGIWVGVLLHVGPAVGRLQAAGPDTVTASLGVVCAAGAGGRRALAGVRLPGSPGATDPTTDAAAPGR